MQKKNVFRMFILFLICGIVYYSLEIIYRGYSHISMFILAGVCGVLFVDMPNNIYSFELGFLKQISISTLLCTIGEGICGLIVNTWLDLNVWDYSNLYGTFFFGQCNLFFVGIWVLIVTIGIFICDAINYYCFKIEPCPYYKIGGKIILKFKKRKN